MNRRLEVTLAIALQVFVMPSADAQTALEGGLTGVRFDPNMCNDLSSMEDANDAPIVECTKICKDRSIDAAFVRNVRVCLSRLKNNPHDPADTGSGPALTALPWGTIITDFFVARLKGEAALFLKTQIADQLCSKKTEKLTSALIPKTCIVLRGADGGIGALPAAFRSDVDALPKNALDFGLKQAVEHLQGEAREAVCLGAVLPEPLAVLWREGPYDALAALTRVVKPHADCGARVAELAEVATWVTAVLKDLEDKQGALKTPADVQRAVRALVRSLLAGRVAEKLLLSAQLPRTDAAKLTASWDASLVTAASDLAKRWEDVEPLLTELAVLIRLIRDGDHSSTTADRAAELTVDITVTLLELNDQSKADLIALARAISAVATKRYLDGVLSLLSVSHLKEAFESNPQARQLWSNLSKWGAVLGALASAKSAQEADGILRAAAVPLGSYREFTHGGWKAFLSAWAGTAGGVDVLLQDDTSTAGAIGPILPIGIEIGHPISGGPTSIQVLISLIDVGALAIARFDEDADGGSEGNNGELRQAPSSSLAALFAPGLFVGIRPKRGPFVLSAGAELLPRSVVKFDCESGQTTCEDTTGVPTLRVVFFAGFDLTAFRIY